LVRPVLQIIFYIGTCTSSLRLGILVYEIIAWKGDIIQVYLNLVSDNAIISGGFEHGDTISSKYDFFKVCIYFHTMISCYDVARRDHFTSTYQNRSEGQYVYHTVREVMIDRYQNDCGHLLSIHSQEKIVHCNDYSHSLRFRLEVHFCIAALAAVR